MLERPRVRARLIWMRILLPLVGLLLAGCGHSVAPASEPSGVEGRVTLGPTCPVETVDNPCPPQLAAEVEVDVLEAGGQDVVAHGTTDADGNFRIVVEPGRYDLTAQAGMFCKPIQVLVTDGEFVTADLGCDTGIR